MTVVTQLALRAVTAKSDSRVVDQHVEGDRARDLTGQGGRLLKGGQVSGESLHGRARDAHLRSCPIQRCRIPAVDQKPGPGSGQLARAGQAHTAGGARDQDGFLQDGIRRSAHRECKIPWALAKGHARCENAGMTSQREFLFRPDSPLTFAIYLVVYLSVVIRVVLRTPEEGLVHPLVYALLAVYLAFSVAHPVISRRWAPWTHIHLAVLSLVVCALLFTEPRLDYYALLFLGLSIVAASALARGADLTWLAAMCVLLTLSMLAVYGARQAASYVPIYVAGPLIMSMAVLESRRAASERAKSEELLLRLTEANRRLREFAEQAEEAAATQERARLARELHDAATQTVFSMNLTVEAARMALPREPERVPGMLDRLQELARDALAEMRGLVDQLRPQSIEDLGLVRALQRHIAMRGRRDGLKVSFSVEGEERGDPATRDLLFRCAREALSNVLKHAGVGEAAVMLRFDPEAARLRVSDEGRGFDPRAERRPESFGLTSLTERVASRGASLEIRSSPGKGTEVTVSVPLTGGAECKGNPSNPSAS